MLKGNSITVRLDDFTMPEEKSDGVKMCIALMARLLKSYGNLNISKTYSRSTSKDRFNSMSRINSPYRCHYLVIIIINS
ncbi:hypothetical protein HRbin04_00578 [archaeon HR04]|nr:hypothetical protein HRbin04_00578 [archaeon HR04]